MNRLPLFLFLIFLLSCRSSPKENEVSNSIEIKYHDSINISLKELNLAESIIPLETNSNCLISKVNQLIIIDNSIFILDEKLQEIFCFDKEGKFKYTINNKKVDKKYSKYFKDISITKGIRNLSVLDIIRQRVYIYNCDGTLLDSIRINVFARQHEWINENELILFLPNPLVNENDRTNVFLQDLTSSKTTPIAIVEKEKILRNGPISFFSMQKWKDGYMVWDNYNSYINFVNIGNKDKIFKIINKDAPPIECYKQKNFLTNSISKYTFVNNLIFIDSLIYLEIIEKGIRRQVISDLQIHETYYCPTKFSNTRFKNGIETDSLGGYPFWPQGCANDSLAFQIIESFELFEFEKINRELKDFQNLNNLLKNHGLLTNPIIRLVKFL